MAQVVVNSSWATDTVVAIESVGVRLHAVHIKQRTDGQSSDTYLSVYNTTSGAVTLGTTAPMLTVVIPKAATAGLRGVDKVIFPRGLRLPSAASFAVATAYNGATGATTTAPAAVEVFYDKGN